MLSLIEISDEITSLKEAIADVNKQIIKVNEQFAAMEEKLHPSVITNAIIDEFESNKDLKTKFLLTSNVVTDPYKYIFPPQSINATPNLTTISLTWDDVPNSSSYIISYQATEGEVKTLKTTNTGATLSGLTPATDYTISVSSANSKITSSPSKSILVTTLNNA